MHCALSFIPVSVVTHVVLRILPSCERRVTLTEEVSGCEVYKHTIQNCSSAPLYDNVVDDIGQLKCAKREHELQFTSLTIFVASVMEVFIYQEHIHTSITEVSLKLSS
jgi:hypothetical protein